MSIDIDIDEQALEGMLPEEPLLPDRLKSGMKVRSKTGFIYTIAGTSKKDEHGEPRYRLVDEKGIKMHKLWTRDELQEEGGSLVEE